MINFGDSNLYVQYIQNFLKENYDKNIHLSDEYDKDTHKALIKYLQLPEIMDSYSLKDLLLNMFTFRDTRPPYKLIDDGGLWNFNFDITLDVIKFYSRPISQCLNGAIRFINEHMDDIRDVCEANGWYLKHYSSLKYDKNNPQDMIAEFTLVKSGRKQLLPTKDIINMINFSTNDYLLGKCFLDENNGYHGFIQDSKLYKISYIPAKPGDVFTIAHGYKYACELAIGYTEYELSDLKNEDFATVNGITSRLSKSTYGELNPNDYEIYHIPHESNCKYLLIQMPYENNITSPTSQKINIKLGDINQDGKITTNLEDKNSDYYLLKQYVEAISKGKSPEIKLSGTSLIAANLNKDIDINGNPIINELDLKIFESQMKNNPNNLDFGEIVYEKKIDLTISDYDKLLVIYGNIEEQNIDNELNIPISDFQNTPWAIHDCFLPYILGSAIHKYSDIHDIQWLQDLIKKIEPRYRHLRWGYYDSANSYASNDFISLNEKTGKYEFYQNGLYTNYILDSNDIYNGNLINDTNLAPSNMKIYNGRFIIDNNWTGKIILSNGYITNSEAEYSLKEIIKIFQVIFNKEYKDYSSKQIKFINGYVDPLTEKRLNDITQGM